MASGPATSNTTYDEEGLRLLLRRDKTITRSLEQLRFGIRILDLATSYTLLVNSSLIKVLPMSGSVPTIFLDTGHRASSHPARVLGHLRDQLSFGLRTFALPSRSLLLSLVSSFSFHIIGVSKLQTNGTGGMDGS